jgi:hypothetical protein
MQAKFGRYVLAGLAALITIYLLAINHHRLPLLPTSAQQSLAYDNSNETQVVDTAADELTRVFNASLGVRPCTMIRGTFTDRSTVSGGQGHFAAREK